MTEKQKMISGNLYNPSCPELKSDRHRAKKLCIEYNKLLPDQSDEKVKKLSELLGKYNDKCTVEPNFFCDYGYNIEFDGTVYINHNSVFLDCAKIKIGNNTLIGPNCGFYTATHPINPQERKSGLESAKPISIGENVWIGGNVTILPGVNIGDNTIIGAGSVVTKDIPSNVVAVGNPCQVIKQIYV